ncbi:MAG: hypothetical protein JW722_06510 [Demequinaceae bacterium]|nr:hypothetical protein [Demequinaceae bacterium]
MSRQRWTAALLITVLSIGLAEVTCASAPWGLVFPPQWILLVPVYGAQTLLVAAIVLRVNQRPTLLALWCAGVVMGLYEFYITHVLWDQPWDDIVSTGLVEVPELLVISMVWHPFMSVILPILLAEQIMVESPTLASALPPRVRRLGSRAAWVVLILFAFQSAGHYSQGAPWIAPLALVASVPVVWGTIRLTRRVGKSATLADVMPTRLGIIGLVACLTVLFGLFIALANVETEERGPISGGRQLMALGLYALFVLLTARNLRHKSDGSVVRFRWVPVNRRAILTYLGIASAVAFIPWSFFFMPIVFWAGGMPFALWLFVLAVRGAFARSPQETTS